MNPNGIIVVEGFALIGLIIVLFSPSPIFNWLVRRGYTDEQTSPTNLYRLWAAFVCLALTGKIAFDLWNPLRGSN
jgi:hypothetical protein